MQVAKLEDRHWFRGAVVAFAVAASAIGLVRYTVEEAKAQGKANAATIQSIDAGMREEVGQLRKEMQDNNARVEGKVDRVIELLLKEKKHK